MIMKKVAGLIVLCLGVCSGNCLSQKSILRLEQATLMNEVRATPSPLDGEHVRMNPPRFMWPDKYPHLGRDMWKKNRRCYIEYEFLGTRHSRMGLLLESSLGLFLIPSNVWNLVNGIGNMLMSLHKASKSGLLY